MVRVGKIAESSCLAEKMVKKGYCGTEGLGLAWDGIKVREIALNMTS